MKNNKVLLGTVIASLSLAGCNGPWFGGSAGKGEGSERREHAFSEDFARDRSALNLGHAHFSQGNFGLALESFHAALAQDGGSVETLNAVAATYDRMGRYDVAKKYYDRALVLAPDSPRTLNNVGYSLVLQGKYDAAMHYFRLAGATRDGGGVAATSDNLALAERLSVQGANPAPSAAARPVLASVDRVPPRQGPYIERNSTSVHTLVTKPRPPETALALVTPDVDPRAAQAPQPFVPQALTHGGADVFVAPAAPGGAPRSLVPEFEPKARPAPRATALLSLPSVEPRDTSIVPTSTFTLEISNGAGRAQMARRTRQYLESRGLKNMRLTNDASFRNKETVVFYQEGSRVAAEFVQKQLPIAARLQAEPKQVAQVRIRLGADFLDFDRRELLSGKAFKTPKAPDVALAPVGGQPGPETLPPPEAPAFVPTAAAPPVEATDKTAVEAAAPAVTEPSAPATTEAPASGGLSWLPRWLGGGSGTQSTPTSTPSTSAVPAESQTSQDAGDAVVKVGETGASWPPTEADFMEEKDTVDATASQPPTVTPEPASTVPDLPRMPSASLPSEIPPDAVLLPPVPPDATESVVTDGKALSAPLSIVPKKSTTKSSKVGNAG
jgi:LytR cell envelope-related transcriptional attenuator/Tetratricopeptide repeat